MLLNIVLVLLALYLTAGIIATVWSFWFWYKLLQDE